MPELGLPKVVWMYWRQGRDSLPFLVQACLESWRLRNPTWDIRLIDDQELARLIDLEGFDQRADISLQALSDIIRVRLLQRHGGIWVDATLFCVKPLDEWLSEMTQDDFFVFSSKRTDRVMTTWFIAANAQSEFLAHWAEEIYQYWRSVRFRRQGYWSRQILRKLMSLRKRGFVSNDVWFSKWVMKGLRIYPYPVNMYLFERMLDRNPGLQRRWHDRAMLYDQPAEHLQNVLGMNVIATAESRTYINGDFTPVHKLNWRQDLGHVVPGSNLDVLLRLGGAQIDMQRKVAE